MPVLYTFLEWFGDSYSKHDQRALPNSVSEKEGKTKNSIAFIPQFRQNTADMKLHLVLCIFVEKFGKYADWMA